MLYRLHCLTDLFHREIGAFFKHCKAMYIAPLEIPAGEMEFAFANDVKENLIFDRYQIQITTRRTAKK